MSNPIEIPFLTKCRAAAEAVNHPWPGAAAAEAWCETDGIHFPPDSNNVLGIKAYSGWDGPTVGATGTEQNKDGSWTGPQADSWCVFPDYEGCFAQQVIILQEPRFADAMAATTIEDYIVAECAVWSTALAKGQCVLATYHAHLDVLG